MSQGTQWSANQMTEADAAMQRQLAFQAQQWMVRLQVTTISHFSQLFTKALSIKENLLPVSLCPQLGYTLHKKASSQQYLA